jgi:RNA-binding protein
MIAAEKKKLKSQAHALKLVVMIGQAGLTDAVLAEIGIALDNHELIKIKIRADKNARVVMGSAICDKTGASLVQFIGQIAVIYKVRPQQPTKTNPKPKKVFARTPRPTEIKQKLTNKHGHGKR